MAEWTVMLHDKIVKRFSIEDGGSLVIGRGKESDIIIDNTAISRKHVKIEYRSGVYTVSDAGSKNGTFVNGKKISGEEFVTAEDKIEFGKFTLVPATAAGEAKEVASSASAQMMDMDDETVFVSSKSAAPGNDARAFTPRDKKHKLTVVSGSAKPSEIVIEGKSSIKIGKDPNADIQISGWFVGKAQCYIIKREKNYCIVPQNSWIGTFVNDTKISDERALHSGDLIKIKDTTIRYD